MLNEIKKAIKKLGITGKISIAKYDRFTVTVSVNGKIIGLWDTVKNTFVD